jgi:hypothetical protein
MPANPYVNTNCPEYRRTIKDLCDNSLLHGIRSRDSAVPDHTGAPISAFQDGTANLAFAEFGKKKVRHAGIAKAQ